MANIQLFPSVCDSQKGLFYCYWVEGTQVKGLIKDKKANTLVSAFVAISAIDEGTAIAVDESYFQGNSWRMGILFVTGGNLTYQTSPDGINFS